MLATEKVIRHAIRVLLLSLLLVAAVVAVAGVAAVVVVAGVPVVGRCCYKNCSMLDFGLGSAPWCCCYS